MRKISLVLFIIIGSCFVFMACTGRIKKSRHGLTNSHYQGALCQNCHIAGGQAKTHFSVGGTVYDEVRLLPQKKAVIKLYTRPKAQGKLVATMESDELGNFYTTQKIDFSQELYPTLLGTPGVKEDTKHMKKRLVHGNCNWCHGIFEESLGID